MNDKTPCWSLSLIFFLGTLHLIPTTKGQCPNLCNGHGTCGDNNICSCFDGFDYSTDCSQRTCPSAPAWADKAYATDLAHTETECANAGFCDRSTGLCKCLPGFTGIACNRARCPNDCNGRGICMTIGTLGELYGPDYVQPGNGGDGKGPVYSNWDKASATSCVCHPGYFGPDCSSVMCPKADDPITIDQDSRSIAINMTSSSRLSGTVRINFNGHIASFRSGNFSDITSAECTRAFTNLKNVEKASCTATKWQETSVEYTVTFDEWPMFPEENNIYSHTGNPPISSFTCDISDVEGTDVACRITDVVSTNTKEYVYCGGRGKCDFNTGDCHCFDGFTGKACDVSTYYLTKSNTLPGAYIENTGTDFLGNMLELRTAKASATDFDMIKCVAGEVTVFNVRGDGEMRIKNLVTDEGMTIEAGGLLVRNGGVTVSDDGLFVENTENQNVLKLLASNTDYSSEVLSIIAQGTTKTAFKLIEAGSQTSKVFTVRGDGLTTIESGGLVVTSGGATITEGGLFVNNGGATIQAGGRLDNHTTMRVEEDGVTITNNRDNNTVLTVQSKKEGDFSGTVLHVKADDASFQDAADPFYLLKASSSDAAVFSVSGLPRTSVEVGGLDVVGGVTIASGGLNITAGGAYIRSGGLIVRNGGVTINDDLKVKGQITVHEGIETYGRVNGTDIYLSGMLNSYYVVCVSLTETSDRRLKTEVRPIASRYRSLFQLDGVSFKWRNRPDDKEHFGFIAQDVEKVFPEMIFEDKSGILSLSYSSFAPLIVEALKAQQLEIESLDQKIKETQSIAEQCINETHWVEKSTEDRLRRIEALLGMTVHNMSSEDRLRRLENSLGFN